MGLNLALRTKIYDAIAPSAFGPRARITLKPANSAAIKKNVTGSAFAYVCSLEDNGDARFEVQLALHSQIRDNSAIGEQQFGTKESVSRRDFRQPWLFLVRLASARFRCPFATILAWRWRIPSFDAPPLCFLGSKELPALAQYRRHEARRRCPGPMRQELCLSSHRSSFLPSSLQRLAEVASFLHGVCCRYSKLQPLTLCSAHMVCDKLTRQGTVHLRGPSIPVPGPIYPRSILAEAAQHLLKRSSLLSSLLLCLPLCWLCPKGRSPLPCHTPLSSETTMLTLQR